MYSFDWIELEVENYDSYVVWNESWKMSSGLADIFIFIELEALAKSLWWRARWEIKNWSNVEFEVPLS